MFAAKRDDRDLENLYRGRFSIYPTHLKSQAQHEIIGERLAASVSARGEPLFYGPYWFLKAGRYTFKIHGEVEGALVVTIVQRPGHALTQFSLPNGVKEANFAIDQDAVKFQCVARAGSDHARVLIEQVEIIRR